MPSSPLTVALPISSGRVSTGPSTPSVGTSLTSGAMDKNLLDPRTDSPEDNWSSFVNWHPGSNPTLTRQAVGRAVALLTKAFPTARLDPEFVWQMCSDVTDTMIERAALTLIQTKREAWPSTNWIAELRMTALAQRSVADDLTPEQRQRLKTLTASIGKAP